VELAVPFKDLGAQAQDGLRFWISLKSGDKELERCPRQGPISLEVPDAAFESRMWQA